MKALKVSEPDTALKNWPQTERPTFKLLSRGAQSLSDAELLAVMLRTGSKDNSTVDRARAMLMAQGTLSAVMFSLAADADVTQEQRARLEASLELSRRCLREKLEGGASMSSPQAVRDYLRLTLTAKPHEVFVCVFLDAQHRVIESAEMFRGTLTQTSVYPREVVKSALRHNAAAVIFAHNHPSGVAEPSRADEALTAALKQALALVDCRVLDHFIVAGDCILSFAERGLI